MLDRLGLVPLPQVGMREALTYWAIMVPLSIAAGAVSWHFYERPWLRLQRAFAYRKTFPQIDRAAGSEAGQAVSSPLKSPIP